MSFTILLVCTGNICRSPMAEMLMRDQLDQSGVGLDIAVSSAGTYGLEGFSIDRYSGHALLKRGIDPSGHVARRLTARMLNDADLILTATSDHLNSRLGFTLDVMRRSFTMKEFALLGAASLFQPQDHISRADLVDRVGQVSANRGHARLFSADLDVDDPYGLGATAADACATEVRDVVTADLKVLGLHPRAVPVG